MRTNSTDRDHQENGTTLKEDLMHSHATDYELNTRLVVTEYLQ